MASFSTNLRFVKPTTGEFPNTWGTEVNNGITELVDSAIAGYASIAMTDADYTLTSANGTADQARTMMLNMTGVLSANRNVICPTGVTKLYFIKNATTGGSGYAITLKYSSGSGISIPNGRSMVLMCDGTNVREAVDFTTTINTTNIAYTGTLTGGTGVVNLGSGQFYKDASGNVGIGVTPSTLLHLKTTTPVVRVETSGDLTTTATSYINFNGSNGDSGYLGFGAGGSTAAMGLFNRLSGPLVLATANTERMRIDSSGKVGIGVDPTGGGRLNINGNMSVLTGGRVGYLAETDTSTVAGVTVANYGGTYGSAFTGMGGGGVALGGYYGVLLHTAGTERMRIDSSGNVGISTTTGLNDNARFKVQSGANQVVMELFGTGSNNSSKLTFSNDNNSSAIAGVAGDLVFYATRNTERMRIDSSGNVGIGATSPGAILHTIKTSAAAATIGAFIQNSDNTVGTEVRLGFAANSNIPSADRYAWIGSVNTGGTNGGALTFATTAGGIAATERMRIDGSGNVHIGGVTPAAGYKLDVYNAANNLVVIRSASTSSASLELAANGNTAGVGGLNIQQNSSNNAIIYNGSAGYLSLGTSGAEAMRITSGGASANVGIGRVPTVKLDVNGGVAIGTVVQVSTASYTILASDYCLRIGINCTLTFPAASSFPGRIIRLFNAGSFSASSATANITNAALGSVTTTIFGGTAGKFADIQSDGTNWYITASN